MTEIEAHHSHLYPGATGRILLGKDGPALIRFADGASASARLAWPELAVAAYTTAAGSDIPAKSWRLVELEDGAFRVKTRIAVSETSKKGGH